MAISASKGIIWLKIKKIKKNKLNNINQDLINCKTTLFLKNVFVIKDVEIKFNYIIYNILSNSIWEISLKL